MRSSLFLALAGTLFCSATPAFAQDDMSVEEIRNAFERQLQAFSSAKTRGLGNGQDRGLKLITVEDIAINEKGEQVVETETPTQEVAVTQETTKDATKDTSEQTRVATDTTETSPSTTGKTPTQTSTETASTTAEPTTAGTPSDDATGATITTTVAGTTATDQPDTSVVLAGVADPNKPLVYGQFKPELQVNLHIEFGFDSAALDVSQKPKLAKMCIVLQTSPINKIRIVGHTDTKGTDEYNERLSILRAREVARHLTKECGISASRLETVGLGERFPINPDDPAADENRRVEFQALS